MAHVHSLALRLLRCNTVPLLVGQAWNETYKKSLNRREKLSNVQDQEAGKIKDDTVSFERKVIDFRQKFMQIPSFQVCLPAMKTLSASVRPEQAHSTGDGCGVLHSDCPVTMPGISDIGPSRTCNNDDDHLRVLQPRGGGGGQPCQVLACDPLAPQPPLPPPWGFEG